MIDKSSLLKSQGSLYLEFIPKDGLFPKMLLLSLMGFLTGWCNLQFPIRMLDYHTMVVPQGVAKKCSSLIIARGIIENQIEMTK